MLSVRTNISAFNAQRVMGGTTSMLEKSMERLSSGFRINRAGDDAAGLAISEKLKAQVSGLLQAGRNAQDGISMIQTAEGAMDQIQNMLQRMRELSVQASNDTLGTAERANISQEILALRSEVQNVAERTKFNNRNLLTGALQTKLDTAGTLINGTSKNNASVTALDVSKATANATNTLAVAGTVLTIGAENIDIAGAAVVKGQNITVFFAQTNISLTLTATAAGTRANLVEGFNGLTIKTLAVAADQGKASLQTGANAGQTTDVAFADIQLDTAKGTNASMTNVWTAVGNFDTSKDQTTASALLTAIDASLDFVSTERAKLGAAQNRLENSVAVVQQAAENLSASNSRIRDVDVATESSNMAKSQILMQSGISVLAQANQMPQLALKLLG